MVEVEGVLERELAEGVCVEGSAVIDDVDVARRPSRGDEGDDGLLQDWVVARETDEKGAPFGDVLAGWCVPGRDGRKVGGRAGGGGGWEILDDGGEGSVG